MKYVSTRGQVLPLSFSEALGEGLAPDGGLFVPAEFPKIDMSVFDPKMTFDQFAAALLKPFLDKDDLQSQLPAICRGAFNFPVPLKFPTPESALLELFHGPTAAFKDVGARFLAECISRLPGHQKRTVLVATSGDTGGAVGGAFVGKPNIDVVILFPKGKISPRQEKQIACWGKNVKAVAVKGNFDDCQKIVKEALSSKELRHTRSFVSANSISIGRLLPQMVYYAKTSMDYRRIKGAAPGFVIPTGNLGNAVAGLWAKHLGFPIDKIVLATNANRSIGDFFASGKWKPNATVSTLANAMDVGNPSNMERLMALYPSFEQMKKDISVVSVSDDQIKKEIFERFDDDLEVYCPHTATAMFARRGLQGQNWIAVATAHPAKFESIVEPIIGQLIRIPPQLSELLNRPSVYTEIEPTLAALKTQL